MLLPVAFVVGFRVELLLALIWVVVLVACWFGFSLVGCGICWVTACLLYIDLGTDCKLLLLLGWVGCLRAYLFGFMCLVGYFGFSIYLTLILILLL